MKNWLECPICKGSGISRDYHKSHDCTWTPEKDKRFKANDKPKQKPVRETSS